MSTMALNKSLRKQLSELLASNRVVLFMKGTRQMPQCGFSAQVVQILNKLLLSYETVDVLDSPEMQRCGMGSRNSPSGPRFRSCTLTGSLSGAATSSAR